MYILCRNPWGLAVLGIIDLTLYPNFSNKHPCEAVLEELIRTVYNLYEIIWFYHNFGYRNSLCISTYMISIYAIST
jgi:hypothetical protein